MATIHSSSSDCANFEGAGHHLLRAVASFLDASLLSSRQDGTLRSRDVRSRPFTKLTSMTLDYAVGDFAALRYTRGQATRKVVRSSPTRRWFVVPLSRRCIRINAPHDSALGTCFQATETSIPTERLADTHCAALLSTPSSVTAAPCELPRRPFPGQ